MGVTENFQKVYTSSDSKFRHTTMVRHNGTVVAFALDENRRIFYAVLDFNSQDTNLGWADKNYWPGNPSELQFGNELLQVGYGVADRSVIPTFKKGSGAEVQPGLLRPEEIDLFRSSTGRFTADAPFQALSDEKYIYIFRQAIDRDHADMLFKRYDDGSTVTDADGNPVPLVNETLLVDRFILSGSQLRPKMEVRYKRSRSKYRPDGSKDSLGARDMEKNPFFEPTQELDFIRNLHGGRFTVLLLPTQVSGIQRWQFFAHNSKTDLLDAFNVERSGDGLFNTRGTLLYTSPDPEYQTAVLERQPGTCPFTGLDLVPAVSQSGYSESALAFDGQSTLADFGNILNPGDRGYTVELWFRCDRTDGHNTLYSKGALFCASVRDGVLHYTWKPGDTVTVEEFEVTPGLWYHLAITYDGQSQRVYKNGIEIHQQALSGNMGSNSGFFVLGAQSKANYFQGQLDEVRVWQRSRVASEIKADAQQRLVGNEPGLAAYWRCDEGGGDRLYDQTDNAHHGTLRGSVNWLSSEAPIGDRVGMRRSSIKLGDRSIVSGMSARLYYQQETAASGYDRSEKPVKKNARVMLAVNTDSPTPSEDGLGRIAVLDFALSREGKLALAPDHLNLPPLTPDKDGGSLNQKIETIRALETKITQLRQEVRRLTEGVATLNQEIAELESNSGRLDDLEREIATLESTLAHYNRPLYATFYEHGGYGGDSFKMKVGETKGWVGDWWNDRISSIKLDSSPDMKIEVFEHAHFGGYKWTLPGATNFRNDAISSIKVLESDSLRENKRNTQRQLESKRGELNQIRTGATDLDAKRAERDRQQDLLNSKQTELTHSETQLRQLKSSLLGEATPLPLPLLHVDRFGLTVSGGLLEFAAAQDAPQLFDSATGKLALYFRGKNDRFFAAYYDTHSAKAKYLLAAETGSLALIARSAEPEMDAIAITVSDSPDDADTCTVTIVNEKTQLTETWEHVPRDSRDFAAVLNGLAKDPVFLGKLAEGTLGSQTLTLSNPLKQPLPAGATLLLEDAPIHTAKAAAVGDTSLKLTDVAPVANLGAPLYWLRYDYGSNARANQPGYSLKRGSLQVVTGAGSATGNVQNGDASSTGATPTCQWVADSPGSALEFDGTDTLLELSHQQLDQLDATGNLTLEAWVQPKTWKQPGRIIHHHSDRSQYLMGITAKSVQSALQFDGSGDFIDLASFRLPTSQGITLEAWVCYSKFNFWSRIFDFGNGSGRDNIVLGNEQDTPNLGLHLYTRNGVHRFSVPNFFDTNRWTHVAVTIAPDGTTCFYKDGQEVHRGQGGLPDDRCSRYRNYIGHSNWSNDGDFCGKMDEARIWATVRSPEEIRTAMNRRLHGKEDGLFAYWQFSDRIAKDYGPNALDGRICGDPTPTDSAITAAYALVAGVGNQFVKEKNGVTSQDWYHLAAVFKQSYALKFDGTDSHLDCGNEAALDISTDLTLEAFVQVENFNQPRGLLAKGHLGQGSDRSVPYALYVNPAGRLVFAFETRQGQSRSFTSNGSLTAGQFHKIAVTRKGGTDKEEKKSTQVIHGERVEIVESVEVNQWDEISFYIDHQEAGSFRYDDADTGHNNGPLEIGRVQVGSRTMPFKGILSEVRIWNKALTKTELGSHLQGSESGLVSWWQLEENQGNVAYDSKGQSHGQRTGGITWVKNPDPNGSSFRLYRNGSVVETESIDALPWGEPQFTIGACRDNGVKQGFDGILEEVRIWKVARSQEQLQDNLFTRLKGEKEDLIANYTFDSDEDYRVLDYSLFGNHLGIAQGFNQPTSVLSTAPIGDDTAQVRSALAGIETQFNGYIHSRPAIQEYGDTQTDEAGNTTGILKRCYGYIENGQWHLITGFKVGNLISEWIGQVQFAPQIIGYVEGAPPVPSENITAGPVDPAIGDYNNVSTLEVIEADNVSYAFSASQEGSFNTAFGMSASLSAGSNDLLIAAPLGFGVAKELTDIDISAGVSANFESSNSWASDSTVGSGRNTSKNTLVALGGNWEDPKNLLNPALGRRFQPANMGFALVQSETADVFALRLKHNNALVSFRFQPNPDIPKDWNIIPFPINPRYTKQGTLDGAVGYTETGKVCDPDYANATGYGEYSYFKPKEAYTIKRRIQREEQELSSYYENFDASPLGGAIGAAVGAGAGAIAGPMGMAAGATFGSLIGALSSDRTVPNQFSKRNLVNTYVWTADGGFFSESTELTDVKQENTSGSYSFSGSVGMNAGIDVEVFSVGVNLEMDASVGGSLNLTKTKTKDSQRSFSIDIAVDTPGDLQQYDAKLTRVYDDHGNPINVPGKVDAYRFMTFYLEGSSDNFEDLFGKVVDPIWLEQSSHPNAAAMRQARQTEKKPPCWRVFHRVTFVSRLLPEFVDATAPPLEKAMKAAHVDSNYQLIERLEPFVKDKTDDFARFADAVRDTIDTYLPELKPHVPDIVQYAALYFDVREAV